MDTVVCDEFLLPEPLTPCGCLVAFPDQHIEFHTFLESWMGWLVVAGQEAYKKDKDRGDTDAPPTLPNKPDRHKRN